MKIDVIIAAKDPIQKYGLDIVRKALDSIINQTYQNWHIYLCNYGSPEEVQELIKPYDQTKITVIENCLNFTNALNQGLKTSTADLIARQDLDDCSEITRFEKQVNFLKDHSSVTLLGTMAYEWQEGDKIIPFHRPEPIYSHLDILKQAKVTNPFIHGSIMFRREALEKIGYYDETLQIAQDFEYWCRFMLNYPVANLNERLYTWRNWQKSTTINRWDESMKLRIETYNKYQHRIIKKIEELEVGNLQQKSMKQHQQIVQKRLNVAKLFNKIIES